MEEDSSSSISSSSEPNFKHKPPSPLSLSHFLNLESQIISSLFSSFFSLFSVSPKHNSPTSIPDDFSGPLSTPGGGIARRVAAGLLGAAYVCLVLSMLMILAVILGVGLVGLWVEEPVSVKETLLFDYSQVNPSAVLALGEYVGGVSQKMEVPVGQTYYIDLVLVLPESDYNIQVGMFQVVAEVISTNGPVIDRSSHPCMLRFRSLPVRLVRTCLFSVPLILGIRFETQKITIPMLKHKERYPRTEGIKISILPRAGTNYLPQLYEAQIVMNSELPWKKDIIHSWKWTLYVWTSVYIYIILLIVLGCWFRPLIFPVMTSFYTHEEEGRDAITEERRERPLLTKEAREVSEVLRRLKESRNKRKEMLLHGVTSDTEGSSASSISVTRDDSTTTAEDAGDLDSVCFED